MSLLACVQSTTAIRVPVTVTLTSEMKTPFISTLPKLMRGRLLVLGVGVDTGVGDELPQPRAPQTRADHRRSGRGAAPFLGLRAGRLFTSSHPPPRFPRR